MKAIKLLAVLVLMIISLNAALAQFDVLFQLTNSTCYNSVKDGSEEGVDCGGLCPACPSQEPEPRRRSQGSSGSSPSVIPEKEHTVKVELPGKEELNYSEENVEFVIHSNKTFDFFIGLSNHENASRQVNITLLNLPDFIELDYDNLLVPGNSEIILVGKTNQGGYIPGIYDAVILLSGENFAKKINLKIEVKKMIETEIESPIKTNLSEPKTPYIVGLLIVLGILVFVHIAKKKAGPEKDKKTL